MHGHAHTHRYRHTHIHTHQHSPFPLCVTFLRCTYYLITFCWRVLCKLPVVFCFVFKQFHLILAPPHRVCIILRLEPSVHARLALLLTEPHSIPTRLNYIKLWHTPDTSAHGRQRQEEQHMFKARVYNMLSVRPAGATQCNYVLRFIFNCIYITYVCPCQYMKYVFVCRCP